MSGHEKRTYQGMMILLFLVISVVVDTLATTQGRDCTINANSQVISSESVLL